MNATISKTTIMTTCKRVTCACVLAIGVVLGGLSLASGMAAAAPGAPCGPQAGACQGPGGHGDVGRPDGPGGADVRPQPAAAPLHAGPSGPDGWSADGRDRRGPGGPGWGEPGGPPPRDLAWRGIDQGRFDHQPFSYHGSWVQPIYNPDFRNWGFWFLGTWIPL
jgi:hypothetical protein